MNSTNTTPPQTDSESLTTSPEWGQEKEYWVLPRDVSEPKATIGRLFEDGAFYEKGQFLSNKRKYTLGENIFETRRQCLAQGIRKAQQEVSDAQARLAGFKLLLNKHDASLINYRDSYEDGYEAGQNWTTRGWDHVPGGPYVCHPGNPGSDQHQRYLIDLRRNQEWFRGLKARLEADGHPVAKKITKQMMGEI